MKEHGVGCSESVSITSEQDKWLKPAVLWSFGPSEQHSCSLNSIPKTKLKIQRRNVLWDWIWWLLQSNHVNTQCQFAATKGEWGEVEEQGSLTRLLSVNHLCFCHAKLRQNSPFCYPSLSFWHPGCCQISSFKSKTFKSKIFPCAGCSWNSFRSSRIWGQHAVTYQKGSRGTHCCSEFIWTANLSWL